MNYTAFGEYTSFSLQAKDAAGKRYAYLNNMANTLRKMAERPEETPQDNKLAECLEDISAADREMRAAVERANHVAGLCNQPELTLASLAKF